MPKFSRQEDVETSKSLEVEMSSAGKLSRIEEEEEELARFVWHQEISDQV